MNEVLNRACRARAQADQGALGATSEGYQSYNLGEGAFATQAGEAIWEYQCRPVIVTARETDECYLQMPVSYQGQNHSDRWGQDFFLEPISRLLVTEGISVECNTKFINKYKTLSGQWIMAISHIRDAQPPTLQNPARPAEVRFRNRVDWSKGGVYSEEELKSFRDYMEFSRYKEVLGFQLTRQLRGGSVDLSHEISPQQLFPGDPGIQILSHGILSYVAGLLFSFGNTASVFIGAYIIYSFVHKVLGYCYKVLVLREAHGWTREIFFCCCSDFLQMRKYRADYRTARANESVYETPRHYRRPPSKGADTF